MNKIIVKRRSWRKPDGTKVTEEKIYTILEVSKWEDGPISRTRMRHAESNKVWEILNQYPDRQSIADSVFLGSERTPQIGDDYENYLDVYKHACRHHKTRGLILSRSKGEVIYTSLTLIEGHAENSIDEAYLQVFEVKHTAEQQDDVINSFKSLCNNMYIPA